MGINTVVVRHAPGSSIPRNLIFLGVIIFITFFLICSNTIYLHRHQFCVHYTAPSDLGVPKSQPLTPIETKSYIFIRDKTLITRLTANSNKSKASIDLLLNIRKLTLFAVHELNQFVDKSQDGFGDSKWWSNPLSTLALKTYYGYPTKYIEHDLTFVAEPDGVPFFVKIRQYNITAVSLSDTMAELEIKGKFHRLDRKKITRPKFGTSNSTVMTKTAEAVAEESADPELPDWPKNKSFLVGDYIDFKNERMFKISPGIGREDVLYCGNNLKMLIMVSSAPKHFKQRRMIRKTYGSRDILSEKGVRLVFLFGIVKDAQLQVLLEHEAKEFDDIIQADFMDSYHNLTLSHLSMYNWIQTTCEGRGLPKYVLKADDDFFLNVDLALRVAYGNPEFELMGVPFCNTRPIRSVFVQRKYYTPRYMYMPDVYVGYLSGVAYLLRTDIIPRILKVSLTTPIIHMDDAYITGLVSRQLTFPPMGSPLFSCDRSLLNPCDIRKMVSSYVHGVDDMKAHWNEYVKPIPANCTLSDVDDLIKINPFRHQDNSVCNLV